MSFISNQIEDPEPVSHEAYELQKISDARIGTHCAVQLATELGSAQSDMLCFTPNPDPPQVPRSLREDSEGSSESLCFSGATDTAAKELSGVPSPLKTDSINLPSISFLLASCPLPSRTGASDGDCETDHSQSGKPVHSVFPPHSSSSCNYVNRTLPRPLTKMPEANDHGLPCPDTEAHSPSHTWTWMDERAPSNFLSTSLRFQVWNCNLLEQTRHHGATRIDTKHSSLFEVTHCTIGQRLMDYANLTSAEVCYARAVMAYGTIYLPGYKSHLPVKLVSLYGSCNVHSHQMEETGLELLRTCGVEGTFAPPAQNFTFCRWVKKGINQEFQKAMVQKIVRHPTPCVPIYALPRHHARGWQLSDLSNRPAAVPDTGGCILNQLLFHVLMSPIYCLVSSGNLTLHNSLPKQEGSDFTNHDSACTLLNGIWKALSIVTLQSVQV